MELELLFRTPDDADSSALNWLQAQRSDSRCELLLQQIEAWATVAYHGAARTLASSQGVPLTRETWSTILTIREAARGHFRGAIVGGLNGGGRLSGLSPML